MKDNGATRGGACEDSFAPQNRIHGLLRAVEGIPMDSQGAGCGAIKGEGLGLLGYEAGARRRLRDDDADTGRRPLCHELRAAARPFQRENDPDIREDC